MRAHRHIRYVCALFILDILDACVNACGMYFIYIGMLDMCVMYFVYIGMLDMCVMYFVYIGMLTTIGTYTYCYLTVHDIFMYALLFDRSRHLYVCIAI